MRRGERERGDSQTGGDGIVGVLAGRVLALVAVFAAASALDFSHVVSVCCGPGSVSVLKPPARIRSKQVRPRQTSQEAARASAGEDEAGEREGAAASDKREK